MPANANPSYEDNDALLTYRVGPVHCCGPTLPIITITPAPKLTHPPGTSIAEPGIFKHGKLIVSATDLRYRFGVYQQHWKNPAQVIITQNGDTGRSYFVDAIIDVIQFPQSGWGQLPSHLPRGIFSRTLLLNDKIYLYAEFDNLSKLQGSGYLAEYIARLEKEIEVKEKSVRKPISKTRANINIENKDTDYDKTKTPNQINTTITADASNLTTKQSITSKTLETQSNTTSADTSNTQSTSTPLIKNIDNKAENQQTQKQLKQQSLSNNSSAIKSEHLKATIEKKSTPSLPIKNTSYDESMHDATKSNPPRLKNNQQPIDTIKPTKINESENQRIDKIHISKKMQQTTPINKKNSKQSNPIAARSLQQEPHSKQSTVAHTQPQQKEPESNHSGILYIIIFLIIISAGYFYTRLTNNNDQPLIANSESDSHNTLAINTKEPIAPVTDINTTLDTESNSNEDLLTEQLIEMKTDNEVETNTTSNVNNASTTKLRSAVNNTTTTEKTFENEISSTTTELFESEPDSIDSSKDASEYHANIQENTDTITIELKGPLPPQINQDTNDKITNKEHQDKISDLITDQNINDAVSEDKNNATKETMNNRSPSTVKEKISPIEIIHIIVKGDTLWAIAKHYLHNPFLYPELAKLSKIKNPDLIYPGNRVIIIYKKNP